MKTWAKRDSGVLVPVIRAGNWFTDIYEKSFNAGRVTNFSARSQVIFLYRCKACTQENDGAELRKIFIVNGAKERRSFCLHFTFLPKTSRGIRNWKSSNVPVPISWTLCAGAISISHCVGEVAGRGTNEISCGTKQAPPTCGKAT